MMHNSHLAAEKMKENILNIEYIIVPKRVDEKIEIDEKKNQNIFFTNFLKGDFKALPEKFFFSKKNTFLFFVEISILTLKYLQTIISSC